MDEDELFDELTDIEFSFEGRAKAEEFERRAADAPALGERRATMVAAAGEHWQMLKEYDRAEACFDALVEAGDCAHVSATAHRISLCLEAGRGDEADELARELRKRATTHDLGVDYEFVGESYELSDQPRVALRWFTMANVDVDPDDYENLEFGAVSGRLRVREALGLSPDRYDESARALRAEMAARRFE